MAKDEVREMAGVKGSDGWIRVSEGDAAVRVLISPSDYRADLSTDLTPKAARRLAEQIIEIADRVAAK